MKNNQNLGCKWVVDVCSKAKIVLEMVFKSKNEEINEFENEIIFKII